MLPALALPESLIPADLPPEVSARLEPWREHWRAFRARVRAERPEADSDAERAVLVDFLRAISGALTEIAPFAGGFVRQGIEQGLDELVRQEFMAAETERKLALRHLQRSLEDFGEFIALAAEQLRGITDEQLTRTFMDAAEMVAGDPIEYLTAEARAFLRWELRLFMALDARTETLDELTYWAHQAIVSSREVRALMGRTLSMLLVEQRPDQRFALPAHVTLAPESASRILDLLDASPGPNAALRELFNERDRSAP